MSGVHRPRDRVWSLGRHQFSVTAAVSGISAVSQLPDMPHELGCERLEGGKEMQGGGDACTYQKFNVKTADPLRP